MLRDGTDTSELLSSPPDPLSRWERGNDDWESCIFSQPTSSRIFSNVTTTCCCSCRISCRVNATDPKAGLCARQCGTDVAARLLRPGGGGIDRPVPPHGHTGEWGLARCGLGTTGRRAALTLHDRSRK